MYRDASSSGPRCDVHPAAPAHASCVRCSAKVCVPCTLYVGLELCCVACTKRARRRTQLSKWTKHAVISLAAIGGGLAIGVPAWQRWRHPEQWVARWIQAQTKEVVAHPCEPVPLRRLVSLMLDAGDLRGAGAALDQSLSFCRFDAGMHIFAFDTHMRIGDGRAAVRDANRLAELWPGMPQPFESRALAHDQLVELEEAKADRAKAQEIRHEMLRKAAEVEDRERSLAVSPCVGCTYAPLH